MTRALLVWYNKCMDAEAHTVRNKEVVKVENTIVAILLIISIVGVIILFKLFKG